MSIKDHGLLLGLDDDDHEHYHNDVRGDARYVKLYNTLMSLQFVDNFNAIIQGAWVLAANVNQEHNIIGYNTSNAQNDELQFYLWSLETVNRFQGLFAKSASAGIVHVYVDDVEQDTIDLYNAVSQYNKWLTITINISGDKEHKIGLKMETKNPLSTGYVLYLTALRLGTI